VSNLIERLLSWGADQVTGPRPQLIQPNSQIIGPKPSARVEAPARFAWDEKRWTLSTDGDDIQVTGRYRVLDRSRNQWREFDGYLLQQAGVISAYIADPPVEIRSHRHGPCLQLVQSPWFRLHWHRQPKDLDGALLYMERMLDESFNG